MATSTIKNSTIKINGIVLQGDQTSEDLNIGYREIISQSLAAKSVGSSGSITTWDKITLSQGVWLINLVMDMQANTGSTGNFGVRLCSNTNGDIWYDMSTIGGPGTTGWSAFNLFRIANVNQSTDVYPGVYQQTGSSRSICGHFHAMKL